MKKKKNKDLLNELNDENKKVKELEEIKKKNIDLIKE